jgi:hypothetical protein
VERQTPVIRAIFDQAREIGSPDDRAAFLDRACADAPGVRAEVEALLRAGDAAGSFLESPAVGRLAGGLPGGSGADGTRTGPASPAADDGHDFLEPSDKPGSIGRLGHYEVQAVVGRGGMGVVLKAFDENLHRVVAVKVMAPQLAASATARQRFIREARAAAAVTHDHIVTIHAVEEASGLPYIVMQFVDGTSLQDRIDQTGPLRLAEVLRIGMQAASGLAAAHAQGLVHRDVKPANILLENGVERVKLTDFGLARAADDASLTQSGTVAGTPSFMSPEQAEGKPVDHRSDLFSLGSVLYAMCTGRPPFRASTNMGVLKRVCEETPKSIRETNPEVPDWLAAVVERLHAKDPAARFQSASEVAEVLGRHLAHVQHPSVVPLPTVAKSAEPTPVPARPERRRRWAVAAAVLAATFAMLGVSEATGVTNVRATVIRIFTPEGTLVVETDDPAVKVVVEGDGDLVITGAGPQEVRLRAGSYRLKATKDGKPVKLDRDLVNITRGDRQIVRVRLEGEAPAAAAPKAETGAFVLLAGKERTFGTLAKAVHFASAGDTIEIRGNGPFVSQPVNIGRIGLTIRAAAGYRPVIKGKAAPGGEGGDYLLSSKGPLVLEGLELHMTGPATSATVAWTLAPLHVANCRFVNSGSCALSAAAPGCTVCNCEFVMVSEGFLIYLNLPNNGTLTLENNLFSNLFGHVLGLDWDRPELSNVAIHLKHNTLATRSFAIGHGLKTVPTSAEPGAVPGRQPVQIHVSANVFDFIDPTVGSVSALNAPDCYRKDAKPLSAQEAENLLTRLMVWREERNQYCKGMRFLTMWRAKDPNDPERGWIDEQLPGCRTLADWQRMWKTGDSGSMEGVIRYEGGDVFAKMEAKPELITAEDFRLRADSAGYRASKDKKDLGADVDLVGPGKAYERWKKTPEYQQWLKETGQVKK